MKILLIHQAFVSLDEAGGTRHYEFARHCVEHGHRFTIVASDLSYLTGKKAAKTTNSDTVQALQGIRVLRAYTYPALHRSFVWRVISFFSFMCTSIWMGLRAGQIDLVMGTSPPIFQGVSAWLVAVIRRRPFLFEIRDLWPEFAVGMGVLKNPILIALSRWLEGFLYRRATHLLVNSPAYRDYLVGKDIPAAKITLIPNGVDPGMFDPHARGARVRQQWQLDGKFVVTYSGAIGLANDIPTILRVADRTRNEPTVHFLLVGDGKERSEMESLALNLNLNNVTFTGARPKNEMGEILAASDVCLATLRAIRMFKMTFPNKVFDYMAAARPTVLAIEGVIRDVIVAANGGICVTPESDNDMAAAILRLQANPQLARAMGESAREYVIKHFNRINQAEDFHVLLQALTKSGE